ncbi:hypothetical protein [Nocardioides sp.]|uniref:hypothetical protein n=1 Tax=Nocardioides sp. TaxID=35761 RepID=UPI00262AD4EB|nr:hypothetical protein [Nocardioides sp.]MCW2736375.1 hypothetical protein [Nocardioides sp.]
MGVRCVARILALLLLSICVLIGSASATAASSCVSVGWEQADANCQWSYVDYSASAGSGDGHTWVVSIQCGNGGICADHVECNENGESGFVHDVYMDGTDVGDVCVPEDEVDQVNIAQLILREFKRIAWPASKLVVQPPQGKTLVNFDTNFYTLDKKAISRDVTVAKQQVTIEAFPTTYTFRFGDDTFTQTASPGRPYPSLDVTHEYVKTGKVSVSLDTTYSGRYRIGGGDWVSIEETITVAGAAQDLEVVEAIPQLVLE